MKSSNKNLNQLNKVLSFLMSECDIDDAALSRETGIPASTISRMRINSETNPTASTLRPLAKFFSISISQLLGDEPLDANRIPGNHNPSFYTFSRLPIISWDLITDWIENNKSKFNGKFMKWLSTEKNIGQYSFALPILTNSFGLAFRKGSIIMIDPEQKPIDGDLILIKNLKNKSISLKQLIIDDTDLYIKSLNQEIKKTKLLKNDTEIIGVVFETRISYVDEKPAQKEKLKNNILQSIISHIPKTT